MTPAERRQTILELLSRPEGCTLKSACHRLGIKSPWAVKGRFLEAAQSAGRVLVHLGDGHNQYRLCYGGDRYRLGKPVSQPAPKPPAFSAW